MQRYVVLLFFILFSFVKAQNESKVTITPEKPKLNSRVHILYQPGKDSPLLGADTVLFQAKYYTQDRKSILGESVMNKTTEGYDLNLDLTGKDYVCVVFQFSGKEGTPVDCNNKTAWDFMIYNQDGTPVKYAYSAIAASYKDTPYPLMREQNTKSQASFLEMEYQRFPNDFATNYSLVLLKSRLNLPYNIHSSAIQPHIDSLLTADPGNISNIKTAIDFYSAIKNTVKYNALLDKAKKLDINTSLSQRRNKIFGMSDKRAKADTIIALYKEAKGTPLEKFLTQDVIMLNDESVDFERYLELTKDLKDPDFESYILSLCSYLAKNKSSLLSSKEMNDPGQNKHLKKVNLIEDKLLEALSSYTKQKDVRAWDNFPSRKQYARKRAIGIGFVNLSDAEYAKGNYKQSLQYFRSAEKLIPNDGYFYYNAFIPYIKSTIELTLKQQGDKKKNLSFVEKIDGNNPDIKEAVSYALDILDKEYSDELAKLMIDVCEKLTLKTDPFVKRINGIKEKQKNERKNEVKSGYKKNFYNAPDFNIFSFAGEKIKLSDLRGKIVILDFWATTCGYCLQSFKYLEIFYTAHKNDKDLFVGAVNVDIETGQSSENKKTFVNNFLKKHKFNLNYYMDYGNTSAPLYQINGVPLLVIIGPDGKIYFREDGFGGPTLADDIEYIVEKIRNK